MAGIGETLRRERLRRNLDLRQIADELKLSTRFLEAIENEQFDRLPAAVFTRSWVRQYASLLGLDGEEMAAEAARFFEPPPDNVAVAPKQPPARSFPLPSADAWDRISDGKYKLPSWFSGLALAVLVTLACSVVYVWWAHAERSAAHAVQRNAPSPQPAVALPQAPAAPASPAEAPPDQAPASAPVQPPALSSAGAPASTGPAPPPAVSTEPEAGVVAKPQAAAAPIEQSAADSGDFLHLQLIAREQVWVRVSSKGATLFEETLAPNQTHALDAFGPVELSVGNAAGIEVQLNGKSIGPLGTEGQIRTLQLTSGGFTIVAPSKPASTPADGPL